MKTVLCYGDANTYGFNPENGLRYSKGERWPGILSELLESGYEVIEEGMNGRTTSVDGLYEPWANGLTYLRPCLKSHMPVDIVVLMLGTNDLKSYFNLSAAQIASANRALIEVIKRYSTEIQGFAPEIILVSPALVLDSVHSSPFYPAFNDSSVAKSKEFAAEYKIVAKENGCIFIDAAPFAEVSPIDSIHLTRAGHSAVARAVFDKISSLL